MKKRKTKNTQKRSSVPKIESGSPTKETPSPQPQRKSTPPSTTPGKTTATKTTPARLSTGTGTKTTPAPKESTAGTKRKESESTKKPEAPRKKQATEPTPTASPPDPVMEGLTFTYPPVKKGSEGAFLDARFKLLDKDDDGSGTTFVTEHGKSDPAAVTWLMRAVCVFSGNAEAMTERGMNLGPVIPRLLKEATKPGRKLFDTRSRQLEKQVLQVGGWTKGILLATLTLPSQKSVEKLEKIYYSKPRASSTTDTMALEVPDIGPLDEAVLRKELWISLEQRLDDHNKAYVSTEERSIQEIGRVANVIQDVLEAVFGKFVLANPDSPYHSGFKYSDKIASTTSRDVGPEALKGFLKNRSDVVGNDETLAVYKKASYDPGRPDDVAARDAILDDMIKSGPLKKKLVRTVQTNGAHSPGKGTIYIQPFISTKVKKTDELWRQSRTLIHEFLHFLTHKQFRTVAKSTHRRQVMIEGVTDMLTASLFKTFADMLSTSKTLSGIVLGGELYAPPPKHLFDVGYSSAGTKAMEILKEVGWDNVEAAYFLGATKYIGVEKRKKETTEKTETETGSEKTETETETEKMVVQ
ncbi:hypothetical protein [Herbidospora sp. RD11066]